jgi:hypothetical protein
VGLDATPGSPRYLGWEPTGYFDRWFHCDEVDLRLALQRAHQVYKAPWQRFLLMIFLGQAVKLYQQLPTVSHLAQSCTCFHILFIFFIFIHFTSFYCNSIFQILHQFGNTDRYVSRSPETRKESERQFDGPMRQMRMSRWCTLASRPVADFIVVHEYD